MRVILELNIEETVPVDYLEEMAGKAMQAISGSGPKVHPRMLVELEPTYLEIPMRRDFPRSSKT